MSADPRQHPVQEPQAEPNRLAARDSATEVGRWLAALERPFPPPGSRERVWRNIESELRRPPKAERAMAIALAAVAAGVVIVAVARGRAPEGEALSVVSQAVGPVQWAPPGGDWVPAPVGTRLRGETQLRTMGNGRAVARLEDTVVLLSEHTATTLRPGNRANPSRSRTEIALGDGTISIAAAPRPADRPLVVTAKGYQVQVVGTVFAVRAAEESVQVWVNDGSVVIRGPATEIQLRSGESWSSLRGRSSETMDSSDAELVRRLADPRGDVPLSIEAKAPADPRPGNEIATPTGDRASRPMDSARGRPLAAAQDRPVSGKRDAPLDGAHGTRRDDARGSRRASAREPVVELGSASGGASTAPSDYEAANHLAERGQYAAAVQAYAAIVERGLPGSEKALYEMGRLRMRYLSDPRGAVDAFEEYRSRFPRGTFTSEVELNLIEALLAIPSLDEASEAIDRFLAAHPRSERRSELLILRGNLRRQQGDCSGALADYDRVIARNDRHGDDALYFSAHCEKQGGRLEAARATFTRYLERFPTGRHRDEAEAALRGSP